MTAFSYVGITYIYENDFDYECLVLVWSHALIMLKLALNTICNGVKLVYNDTFWLCYIHCRNPLSIQIVAKILFKVRMKVLRNFS